MITELKFYISRLENYKNELEKKKKSFDPASLFSAIGVLMNFGTPCSSSDYQKIIDVSQKSNGVIELIPLCQMMLQKLESNQPLAQNDETFLEYISMVSQILEMTSDHQTLQVSMKPIFLNYNNIVCELRVQLSNRFDAFMNYMKYSFYHQRKVPSNQNPWTKKSGSPSIVLRDITEEDNLQIEEKKASKNAEIQRLSDECNEMTSGNAQLLLRLSELSSSVSKAISDFKLNDFPEISFYLSGFNSEQFVQFRNEFQIIHQTFQSLKTDIDAFNKKAESLSKQYLKEYNKPDEYLTKWYESFNGSAFFGKKD